MIPYFSIEFFKIGPLAFYTWGFFVALAFLAGAAYAFWQGKKIGVEFKKIIYLVIFIYLGAIAGARLFFVLQRPGDFFGDPSQILRISEGGMMFYGGLFGGLIAGWLYIRRLENRWALIDALAPAIPLAIAIGRIGCFLINDHQGVLTSLSWAIRWPDGTLRHPVVLYLILFNLVLFGFLWWRQGKMLRFLKFVPSPQMRGGLGWGDEKQHLPFNSSPQLRRGGLSQFVIFLLLYSAGRFLLDFTRDASADPHILGLAVPQWISAFLLTIVVIYYIIHKSKRVV